MTLVAIGTAELDAEGHASVLRKMQQAVADASPADAADMAERARMASKVLAAMKAAGEIRREAFRLEAMAMRRLGQLQSSHLAGPQYATACDWFAALSQDDFDSLISDSTSSSPLGIYRKHLKLEYDDVLRRRGIGIGNGTVVESIDHPMAVRDLAEAAGALLTDYTNRRTTFSVSEVAEELADELGMSRYDAVVREGLREVVRQAINIDSQNVEERWECDGTPLPRFVTYHEDCGGWVRVPIATASAAQLRCMVELREAQALDLLRAAEKLRAVLTRIEEIGADHPGLTGVLDIASRSKPGAFRDLAVAS
jgi:hypothetical protein